MKNSQNQLNDFERFFVCGITKQKIGSMYFSVGNCHIFASAKRLNSKKDIIILELLISFSLV